MTAGFHAKEIGFNIKNARDASTHFCDTRRGFWEKHCMRCKNHRILCAIAKCVALHVYSVYIVICFDVSVVLSILTC